MSRFIRDRCEISRSPPRNPLEDLLHREYGSRCSICLNLYPRRGCRYTPLINPEIQLSIKEKIDRAMDAGLLPPNYAESSESRTNGTILCPTCRNTYFHSGDVHLSLPTPVLKYLYSYITNVPREERIPVYRVFEVLLEALDGNSVRSLPDPNTILPYLGLVTIAPYYPQNVCGCLITTPHQPHLSVLRSGHFVPAAAGDTDVKQPGMVRIYDPSAIKTERPRKVGVISPEDTDFVYWRLPIQPCAVLVGASVTCRLSPDGEPGSPGYDNLALAVEIRRLLRSEM